MRFLICASCGTREEWDPDPSVRCLGCGAQPREATRCFACRRVVPQNPTCAGCGARTLPPELYAAARVLCSRGGKPDDVSDRARTLSLKEQRELESEYRTSWIGVDDLFDELIEGIAALYSPSEARGMIEESRRMLAAAAPRPEDQRQILLNGLIASKTTVLSAAPFPVAVCKAIAEAAPRLDGRRGLVGRERRKIVQIAGHAGPDRAFALRRAYLHEILEHPFIVGEPPKPHDPRAILALRGGKPPKGKFAAPAAAIRDGDIVWAVGPRPSPDPLEPWKPDRYVFRGRPLDDLEAVGKFLRIARPPADASVVHWILAMFPWEATAEFQAAPADPRGDVRAAVEKILGLRKRSAPAKFEAKIDQQTFVYRPPELQVRG